MPYKCVCNWYTPSPQINPLIAHYKSQHFNGPCPACIMEGVEAKKFRCLPTHIYKTAVAEEKAGKEGWHMILYGLAASPRSRLPVGNKDREKWIAFRKKCRALAAKTLSCEERPVLAYRKRGNPHYHGEKADVIFPSIDRERYMNIRKIRFADGLDLYGNATTSTQRRESERVERYII